MHINAQALADSVGQKFGVGTKQWHTTWSSAQNNKSTVIHLFLICSSLKVVRAAKSVIFQLKQTVVQLSVSL